MIKDNLIHLMIIGLFKLVIYMLIGLLIYQKSYDYIYLLLIVSTILTLLLFLNIYKVGSKLIGLKRNPVSQKMTPKSNHSKYEEYERVFIESEDDEYQQWT